MYWKKAEWDHVENIRKNLFERFQKLFKVSTSYPFTLCHNYISFRPCMWQENEELLQVDATPAHGTAPCMWQENEELLQVSSTGTYCAVTCMWQENEGLLQVATLLALEFVACMRHKNEG